MEGAPVLGRETRLLDLIGDQQYHDQNLLIYLKSSKTSNITVSEERQTSIWWFSYIVASEEMEWLKIDCPETDWINLDLDLAIFIN